MRVSTWCSPAAVVWGGMATFAAGLGTLAALEHRAFETGRFDLGNMAQAVWSTAHGRPLEVTELHGDQITRLGAHVDPLLAAFAPVWWLWPSPAMLVVCQAIILALGALPVFWLARKHLGSARDGALCGIAYLLYPPIQWLALDEFHPVALACPLLTFAFWYLDEDRLRAAAPFLLLAALSREEMPLVVGALGVWYALAKSRRVAGALVALAGAASSAIAFGVVMPYFREGTESAFFGRYETVGGSPVGILETVFRNPGALLGALTDGRDLLYLLALGLPLALLFLLSPLILLAAIPELAANLLSSTDTQTSIRFHYTAPIVPFLIGGAVLGAARLPRPRVGALILLGASLAGAVLLGPLRAGELVPDRRSPHDGVAVRALALIPEGAAVSSTNGLGAHLSARRRIHSFPVVRDADWIVVDLARASYLDRRSAASTTAVPLAELLRSGSWATEFEEDGVFVLRRATTSTP